MHVKTKTIKQKMCLLSLSVLIGLAFAPPSAQPPEQTDPKPDSVPVHQDVQTNNSNPTDNVELTGTPIAASSSNSQGRNSANSEVGINKPNRETNETTIIEDGKVYQNKTYTALATPNDPHVGESWESTIDLSQSRNIVPGAYTPKLAIIDSGFALNHEDLRGIWLTNSGESGTSDAEEQSRLNCSDQGRALNKSCNLIDDNLNGVVDDESGATSLENTSQLNCSEQGRALNKSCNLIDDDGNGLVDDYTGYDFANSDHSVRPGEVESDGDGVSHGTLVAGIAAGINNNNKGIAGVSSQVKVLPIQALEDDGAGYTTNIADAIVYAVDRGADIISLSLGGEGDDPYTNIAISYAAARGTTIIAASGNEGCECVSYPAANIQVIAVGASEGNSYADFSNYGPELDVLAPGVNLISTIWTEVNPTGAYSYTAGTSVATPIVSGLVANLLSHDPALSPLQVKALLTEKTTRLAGASSPRDDRSGFGRINAQKSLQRITTPLTDPQIYELGPVRYGQAKAGEWQQQETTTPLRIYDCSQRSEQPTTAVYRLKKSETYLYTASSAEEREAKNSGYQTSLGYFGCVLFNHDRPKNVRTINILKEFENLDVSKD